MTNYRVDEDFDGFLNDFGEPFEVQPIGESVIKACQHKLPEQLFTYWRSMGGACGFGDGLFWMVNPAEYEEILQGWLEETPFKDRQDLSVIARNGFGKLFIWAKAKGEILTIKPHLGVIYYKVTPDEKQLNPEQEAFEMQWFWGGVPIDQNDYEDETGKLLFDRAYKKLGKLKSDEMYGFRHSLCLGGKALLKNLEIVKLDVYHDIARQMDVKVVNIII